MKAEITNKCAFCYDREQGTHGEIKKEWSPEFNQYFWVCQEHVAPFEPTPEWNQNVN